MPAESIRIRVDPETARAYREASAEQADYLVTGDDDLLVLHPFRGIPILTPATFLEEIGQSR